MPAVEVAECLGEKLSADSATRSSGQDVEREDVTPVRVVWVCAVAAEAEKLVAPRLGDAGRPGALAEQSPQPAGDLVLVETAKNRFGDDPPIRLSPGRDEHLRELYRILDEADAKTDVKVDPRIRD